MIESTPGVHGGYKLARNKVDISFLDVIQAIEGTASLFHCDAGMHHDICLIQEVMRNAERHMEDYLKERKLVELVEKNPGLLNILGRVGIVEQSTT